MTRPIVAVAVISLAVVGACSSSAPSAPVPPPSAQPSAPQPSTVSLTGGVQGQGTGPIVGAVVVILDGPDTGRSTTTGGSGLYRLDDLTAGNANVSATASNYLGARDGTFINGTNTLNFTLSRAGFWSQSGVGPQQFVAPPYLAKVKLTADFAGACEYFQVRFQTGWIVNTSLGDCTTHHLEGTYVEHVQGGGPVQVLNSVEPGSGPAQPGVVWTLAEVP